MKSAVRLLAVFAIAILAGFASQAQAAPDCGENTGKKATGKPIPIGAVTTMSGIGSFKEADDAVRAYFDCVNANGGIHGRPITYHDEDDQSQLDVAAQAAKKLVGDEGVYAMIGSTSIIECIPNANYYLKENIVEIGEGIPPQCYQSKNIAEVNAGPRASAVMTYGTDDIGARIVEAAQQQDGAAKMKWLAPTSFYTVRFPGAIDTKYWNDRYWVNAELAPLASKGKDNQNWVAVMDAYGGKALRDSFSQAGYIAARVAVRAMLTIKNPDDINRNTVTAAIQNMPPYETDILCMPWYWGGATEHNPNHVTRMAMIHDGKWKTIEGCVADPDPALGRIEALEQKLGLKISDTAQE